MVFHEYEAYDELHAPSGSRTDRFHVELDKQPENPFSCGLCYRIGLDILETNIEKTA